MRMSAIAPLVLAAILFGGFGVAFLRSQQQQQELPSVYINQPAPVLPDAQLGTLPIIGPEDIQAPGLKLVNFWASWCPPCRAEHPNLMRLAQEGWTIIGINKSDAEANALGFLSELGNPYKVVGADPDGRGSIEWGVYGLPETFLVDGKGHIRLRHPGPVTQRVWSERFVPVIEALAQE